MAEYYYHSAIQMGGAPGLSYYALGVNAFADNRTEDAEFYLSQSIQYDPEGFGDKSKSLLDRIDSENEPVPSEGM